MSEGLHETLADFDGGNAFLALALGLASTSARWRALLDAVAPEAGAVAQESIPTDLEHPGFYALLGLVAVSRRLDEHLATVPCVQPPAAPLGRDEPKPRFEPLR